MNVQWLLVRIDCFNQNHVSDVNDQDEQWDGNYWEDANFIEHENEKTNHNEVNEVELMVPMFFKFLADLSPRVLTQKHVFEVVHANHCNEKPSHYTNQSSETHQETNWDDFDIFVTHKSFQKQSCENLKDRPNRKMVHQVVSSLIDFESAFEVFLKLANLFFGVLSWSLLVLIFCLRAVH